VKIDHNKDRHTKLAKQPTESQQDQSQ